MICTVSASYDTRLRFTTRKEKKEKAQKEVLHIFLYHVGNIRVTHYTPKIRDVGVRKNYRKHLLFTQYFQYDN